MMLVRTLDASGEITKTYPQDLETHGRDVRKIRALRQLEDLEWIENLREVVEGADADSVRESRQLDRLALMSWSDPCKRAVLLGDAAHGMFPGPAQGARMAFEDAH